MSTIIFDLFDVWFRVQRETLASQDQWDQQALRDPLVIQVLLVCLLQVSALGQTHKTDIGILYLLKKGGTTVMHIIEDFVSRTCNLRHCCFAFLVRSDFCIGVFKYPDSNTNHRVIGLKEIREHLTPWHQETLLAPKQPDLFCSSPEAWHHVFKLTERLRPSSLQIYKHYVTTSLMWHLI